MLLTYLRYALATVCFAASVGCLAMWWRSHSYADQLTGQAPWNRVVLGAESRLGLIKGIRLTIGGSASRRMPFRHKSESVDDESRQSNAKLVESGTFFRSSNAIFFPHWFGALIFALAGFGVLRFRRRFSIRSALICVSVVALLLGMAVIL